MEYKIQQVLGLEHLLSRTGSYKYGKEKINWLVVQANQPSAGAYSLKMTLGSSLAFINTLINNSLNLTQVTVSCGMPL
jgi:hypothetical protein